MCKNLNRLIAFYHCCIRPMLGVTRNQQGEQHITSTRKCDLWEDHETVDTKITKCRLEWMGHVARMPDHRMPKLQKTRPPGGPRKRWRDVFCKDLQGIGVRKHSGTGQLSQEKDGVPSTMECRTIQASRNKRNHLSDHTR